MKILVDCRYMRIDAHDGISRFTANIVREIGMRHPVTMLISDHRQLALLPDLPWELISSPTNVLREIFVARQVRTLQPDVIFSPMQTMGSWGRNYGLVLTLHDLIYYQYRTPPPTMPPIVRVLWRIYHLAWWPQRLMLNRADAIVAVSETTANLMNTHRLTTRPVTIATNAADDLVALAQPRTRPSVNRLLYMGSFMPYKGVDVLVRAAAELPDYELHLLSRITDEDRLRLSRLAPTARVVFHNQVSDDEYIDLLQGATALLSASRVEGFGIPVVEAMRMGTPVVISDIPVFHEVGGDAALFFDPTSPDALVAIVRALETPGEWERRSAAVIRAETRFRWGHSAEAIIRAMTEVVESRGSERA
ncbi:MAG: mannosyltransferase [Candidatus Lumbricidophila eiseniae]|uniref:Mannosyltransferase n=1 Tax=Candidatus Lumbricidiphila eiseniae TaxID=1969409 RepID=A0A2A6FRQ8_9MICO|nr:MAG: mannosyltransferase [Candidatus Lumbricidophila eiseniae]